MDVFIGFVTPFPWNWPPLNWTLCQGQLLAINQYDALYSLLGPTFGGDGRSNFGVPDLRGRQIVGMGAGPGLYPKNVGDMFGREQVTLTSSNLPSHTHTLTASNTAAENLTQDPAADWTLGAAASISNDRIPVVTPVQMYGPSNPTNPVQSQHTSSTGDDRAFDITPPSLCLNFCIALNGIYPSRN